MYEASVLCNEGFKYEAKTRGGSFIMDSEGLASNPVDTLLASLCGCISHYVRKYIKKEQLGVNEFKISAESELTAENDRLADISMLIDFEGMKLDEHIKLELLGYVKGCPIHNTLKANSAIHMKIK